MSKNGKLIESLSLSSSISRQIFNDCTQYLIPFLTVSCAINLLFLASPIYMLQVYDRVLGSGSLTTLWMLALIATFCCLLMGALDYIRARALTFLGAHVFSKNASFVLELSALKAAKSGHASTVGLRELDVIKGFVSGGAANTLLDAPCTPVFLIVTYAIHPALGAVTFVGGAILFFIAYWSDRHAKSIADDSHDTEVRAFEFAAQFFSSADYFVATGRIARIQTVYNDLVDRQLHSQLRVTKITSYALSVSKFLRLILQIAILGLGVDFPRFDGQFFLHRTGCFSCREQGTRTRRNFGNISLRWPGLGAASRASRGSLSRVRRPFTFGSRKPSRTAVSAMMA